MLKQIFIINGSASSNSSNEKLIRLFVQQTKNIFSCTVFNELKSLPHFNPELSADNPPAIIQSFRQSIANADAVLICTPEYVFSIPSGLKNCLEWCVATMVFTDKPLGIITASAHGQKGHAELQLIMQTLSARFTEATTLLIQGIKGKMNEKGMLTDKTTVENLNSFIKAFTNLVQ
ncbi:MAG: FMN reductase [Chitinophaga sp.]|jgi:chromate reductase, NAD(P)H dehydrogenase (quinone)|nr:FMN reductase [Chitinophaga sp.]